MRKVVVWMIVLIVGAAPLVACGDEDALGATATQATVTVEATPRTDETTEKTVDAVEGRALSEDEARLVLEGIAEEAGRQADELALPWREGTFWMTAELFEFGGEIIIAFEARTTLNEWELNRSNKGFQYLSDAHEIAAEMLAASIEELSFDTVFFVDYYEETLAHHYFFAPRSWFEDNADEADSASFYAIIEDRTGEGSPPWELGK